MNLYIYIYIYIYVCIDVHSYLHVLYDYSCAGSPIGVIPIGVGSRTDLSDHGWEGHKEATQQKLIRVRSWPLLHIKGKMSWTCVSKQTNKRTSQIRCNWQGDFCITIWSTYVHADSGFTHLMQKSIMHGMSEARTSTRCLKWWSNPLLGYGNPKIILKS